MEKKILIIDDEPDFVKPIIDILGLLKIPDDNIIYCQQIDEGFKALELEKGSIVCVSLDMLIADPMNVLNGEGEINGLKVLKYIRQSHPKLPIVCFTIMRDLEGNIKEFVEKSNATFISKTDSDSVEKLIRFFLKCYGAS